MLFQWAPPIQDGEQKSLIMDPDSPDITRYHCVRKKPLAADIRKHHPGHLFAYFAMRMESVSWWICRRCSILDHLFPSCLFRGYYCLSWHTSSNWLNQTQSHKSLVSAKEAKTALNKTKKNMILSHTIQVLDIYIDSEAKCQFVTYMNNPSLIRGLPCCNGQLG